MGRAQGQNTAVAVGRADHSAHRHSTLPDLTPAGLRAAEQEHEPAAPDTESHESAAKPFDTVFGGDRGRGGQRVTQLFERADAPQLEPLDPGQRLAPIARRQRPGALRSEIVSRLSVAHLNEYEVMTSELSEAVAFLRKRSTYYAPETALPDEMKELAAYIEQAAARLNEGEEQYRRFCQEMSDLAHRSAELDAGPFTADARDSFGRYSGCAETFLNCARELKESADRLNALYSQDTIALNAAVLSLSTVATQSAEEIWQWSDFLEKPLAMTGAPAQAAPQDLRHTLSAGNLGLRIAADASRRRGQPSCPVDGRTARDAWGFHPTDEQILNALDLGDEEELKRFASAVTGHARPLGAEHRLGAVACTANGRVELLTGDPVALTAQAESQVRDDNNMLREKLVTGLADRIQERIAQPSFDQIWQEAVKRGQSQMAVETRGSYYTERNAGARLGTRAKIALRRRRLDQTQRQLSYRQALRLAGHPQIEELGLILRDRATAN